MPAATARAAAVTQDRPQADPEAKKKGKGRLRLIVVAVLLLAGAGGGFAWWRMQAAAAHAAEKKAGAPARAPAQYHALEPAFVVNLADTDALHYLQADVQLVTRDAATLAAFETHAPAIRNRLLLLFGQQTSAQLARRSGKERLQEAARAEVAGLLQREGAPARVEAVIFTSLVTQ